MGIVQATAPVARIQSRTRSSGMSNAESLCWRPPSKDATQLPLSRAGVINIPIPSSDLMGNVHTIQIGVEKRRIV